MITFFIYLRDEYCSGLWIRLLRGDHLVLRWGFCLSFWFSVRFYQK